MPKKSNKTAHVLSLLTNGAGDPEIQGSGKVEEKPAAYDAAAEPVSSPPKVSNTAVNVTAEASETVPSKSALTVEIQDNQESDALAALVRADLENELREQIKLTAKQSPRNIKGDASAEDDRPPYSDSFMANLTKLGINSDDVPLKNSVENSVEDLVNTALENAVAADNSEGKSAKEPESKVVDTEKTSDEHPLPLTLDQVKSEIYVLEKFTDEDDEEEMNFMENKNITNDSMTNLNTTRVLRNLAEDAMKNRAPEIMKSFNMCTCQDCVYDVMALALNHTKPLYTVTEKGELFQKLASYETQYGTDLISEVTKACIKVKLTPRHPGQE